MFGFERDFFVVKDVIGIIGKVWTGFENYIVVMY